MSTAPVLELPAVTETARRAGPLATRLSALTHAVHVWLLPAYDLEERDAFDRDRALLSADERARADAFHFAIHRDAFTANRARLRKLLALYLCARPESLTFTYGPQGKPALAAPYGDADNGALTFNLSHTDGLAVVALSRGRRIGVDVERVQRSADLLDLARQHFAPEEYRQLAALPAAAQADAFYACWTRKESFLKGLGSGLAEDLSAFQVSFLPGEPASLLACQWSPELRHFWRFCPLDPGDGYAGALAYEGGPHDHPLGVATFTWHEGAAHA